MNEIFVDKGGLWSLSHPEIYIQGVKMYNNKLIWI